MKKKAAFRIAVYVILIIFIAAVDIMIGVILPRKNDNPQGSRVFTAKGNMIIDNNGELKLMMDPVCVYKHFPNQDTGIYKINSNGFRGKEINIKKGEGITRVVILGGSSAFGWYVTDNKDTISQLIEKDSEKLEVINAGILGYTSLQELNLFITDIKKLEPDVVISYNLWNDLFFGMLTKNYRGVNNIYNIQEKMLTEYSEISKNSGLLIRFSLLNLFNKTNLGKGREMRRDEKSQEKELARINRALDKEFQDEKVQEAIRQYKRNVKIINGICKADNIKHLVVIQPEINSKTNQTPFESKIYRLPFSNYGRRFSPVYQQTYNQMEKFLDEENIEYLNINKSIEFIDHPETLFIDFIHTNPTGNKIIADLIRVRL